MNRTIYLPAEADTRALGEAFVGALESGTVIHLLGELGAGKTTLARALIQAMVPGARVKSPTYTLLESYDAPAFSVHHLDLYRIADPDEVEFLGLREVLGTAVVLVEWPERGGNAVPRADLAVLLEVAGDGRLAELRAQSTKGEQLLAAIA